MWSGQGQATVIAGPAETTDGRYGTRGNGVRKDRKAAVAVGVPAAKKSIRQTDPTCAVC